MKGVVFKSRHVFTFKIPKRQFSYSSLSVPELQKLPNFYAKKGDNDRSAIEQGVGDTPILYLRGASEAAGCNIYGKAEFMNVGGSVKDRAAMYIIRDAEERGVLKRGRPGVVLEGTAGNTGIGMALISGVLGYHCVVVIPRTQTQEKKDMLRQAGAELIEVDAAPFSQPNHYVKVAERLAQNLERHLAPSGVPVLYANQWDNLANQLAHVHGTGPELVRQMESMGKQIDVFSCAVGTGGTLTGVGKFLKATGSSKVCLTDPRGAVIRNYFTTGKAEPSPGSSISEGIGLGRVSGQIADGFVPDYCLEVEDSDMMNAIHDLQIKDGIMIGLSGGVNVAGAIQVAKHYDFANTNPDANIVTVLCDLSNKYVSKQFNIPFLKSKNLPTPPWYGDQRDLNFAAQIEQAHQESIL